MTNYDSSSFKLTSQFPLSIDMYNFSGRIIYLTRKKVYHNYTNVHVKSQQKKISSHISIRERYAFNKHGAVNVFNECKLKNGTDHYFVIQTTENYLRRAACQRRSNNCEVEYTDLLKKLGRVLMTEPGRLNSIEKTADKRFSLSTPKPLHLSGTWKIGIHT